MSKTRAGETGRANVEPRSERKPRADGVESRRVILLAAAKLATTRGLESLSIGELAEHIGMSKSGLYAHFKSKEELELATIETALEIFDRDVIRLASDAPRGLGRVRALSEAFLGHLERGIFPGGCFFANVSMQLAARPGRPRERVMEVLTQWMTLYTSALHEAVAAGELPKDADVDQLAFELNAMLVRANFNWILTGEPSVLDQARRGIEHVIERVTGKPEPATSTPSKSAARRRPRASS
ncbi:MAG: TetR/AcrR family transcriptional regulator [Isosphaeraceae bacterium]